jgi:hypothetical protein
LAKEPDAYGMRNRADYVKKQGWATINGNKKSDGGAVKRSLICAGSLSFVEYRVTSRKATSGCMRGERMAKLCAMCEARSVYGKGIDKSKPAVRYMNPVDKLTSTISWPTVYGKYCYFCDKKKTGLIRP